MATFRQLVNRVLTALGNADDLVATAATSLTDAYHLKVAQFVNDILEEVEAAAQWRALRTRDTATVTANNQSATLATANERSRVFYVQDAARRELVPLVFDVTNTSNQKRLKEMDLSELLYRDQRESNTTNGNGPSHYALSPTATGMDIYVYPRSSANVDLEVDLVIPQARIPTDTLDDLDTVIKVPGLAVVLGATWWALEDRGEELGPNGEKADMRYQRELSARVASEMDSQGLNDLVPI